MKETLCRRRCLLKISKNYTGFEAETNVFAEHRPAADQRLPRPGNASLADCRNEWDHSRKRDLSSAHKDERLTRSLYHAGDSKGIANWALRAPAARNEAINEKCRFLWRVSCIAPVGILTKFPPSNIGVEQGRGALNASRCERETSRRSRTSL